MPLLDLNERRNIKMPKILIIYSSTDGQTKRICERIKMNLFIIQILKLYQLMMRQARVLFLMTILLSGLA